MIMFLYKTPWRKFESIANMVVESPYVFLLFVSPHIIPLTERETERETSVASSSSIMLKKLKFKK